MITIQPRQAVWYDAKNGKWMTTVIEVNDEGTVFVEHARYRTEAEANQAVGIEGGSPDPAFHPSLRKSVAA